MMKVKFVAVVLGVLALGILAKPMDSIAWAEDNGQDTAATPAISALDAGVPEAMIVGLADLIRKTEANKKGKVPYHAVRMIEVLFYRGSWIESAMLTGKPFKFKLRGDRISYEPNKQKLSYSHRALGHFQKRTTSVQYLNDALVWTRTKGGKVKEGQLDLSLVSSQNIKKLRNEIYQQILGSRGYRTQYLKQAGALDLPVSETTLEVREKWARDGSFKGAKWEFAPVRIASWAVQKAIYDVPEMATSAVVESVTRSPLHNLFGAGLELKGSGKLALNALVDISQGIRHPSRASFVDGTLELLDASLKLGSAALDLAKAGISMVAYPVYRLFGGKKSQHVALPGKRAVIVLVDTGMPTGGEGFAGKTLSYVNDSVDTYGESIVRSKLKSISDYYCINSNAQPHDIRDCIDRMPTNIQYLDIVSLQHSGGMREAEEYAEYARKTKGVRPELLLSIGCYDDPSSLVEGENTLGQKGLSWAVHYYLANLIEKRLRGIPAHEAGKQAYREGMLINSVDPISWMGVAGVAAMGGGFRSGASPKDIIKAGYSGSAPDVISPDTLVRSTLEFQIRLSRIANTQVDETQSYIDRVKDLVANKQIELAPATLKLLEEMDRELAVLGETRRVLEAS